MVDPNLSRRDFIGQAAALGAAGLAARGAMAADEPADPAKILNHNPKMEYRKWGKSGLMISAVCLGGHWKRVNEAVPGCFKGGDWLGVDMNNEGFHKNRYDVVSKCIEVGINYIDACTHKETLAYSRALKGRRDKMYLGYSWYEHEMRNGAYRTQEKLLQSLEEGMKLCGLDYVDLWRITMHEKSSQHTEAEVEQMMKALEAAKKQGKARFTGFSSHDRPHIKTLIETYPGVVDAVVTPYTAKTKELPQDSLFETLKKSGVAMFGIKPYSSGSIFKGKGLPGDDQYDRDCEVSRMSLRYILGNPAVTAPIPGMICPEQVENAAKAVQERRELDKAELERLEKIHEEAWANLPPDYQWLKGWEWV
jgi:predicted aldo/keto reductase-like oxidoreductase